MTRRTVGETLAHRLYAAEAAVDAALAAAARLAAELPVARAGAMVSAVTGQRAFDGAAGAVSALVQARSQLVRTHGVLAAVARKLKLDDLAVGPVDKPEDDPPIGGGVSRRKPVEPW
ncbi:hypothetical protein [Brevundimonas fluminis]|jgi:hypothetical protein|uniref:hypothetical protein n=1 Tax=Brevundimonas fluminis TaxID=2487274 RepID=UPI000F6581A0|nr:hypothetical protein [Brevundimonas fluminis]